MAAGCNQGCDVMFMFVCKIQFYVEGGNDRTALEMLTVSPHTEIDGPPV